MTTRPCIDLPLALKPLEAHERWVLWKWGTKANGEFTKIPHQGSAPNYKASTTSPRTWCSFKVAMRAYTKGAADGIGYVLTDGDVSATDIDNCRNATSVELHPWAREQIERSNSYAEVTPSGEGVRIIGLSAKDGTTSLNNPYRVPNTEVTGELYARSSRRG
jgi:putative DNA primase/helicase